MPDNGASSSSGKRSWTNRSVIAFAQGRDPLDAAQQEAQALLTAAVQIGAVGPPLDVFALAAHLGITLTSRDDLVDAQIRSTATGLVMEYNPSRPRGRLRFSIAHELAHSRFSDVGDRPRHRSSAGAVPTAHGDDWELELLCDVIAADLLMPSEIVDGLATIDPDIDFLMEHRRRLDVSTEALLRRVVRASQRPLTLVAFSRPSDANDGRLRADYVDTSAASTEMLPSLAHGDRLDGLSTVLACSAVGQTSRGEEKVMDIPLRVQAVGIPAYPGRRWPRVLALLEPAGVPGSVEGLDFVTGDIVDALSVDAPIVIAHVVPDATHAWSRFGAGGALGRAYPEAAAAYRAWVLSDPSQRQLGAVHFAKVASRPGLTIASVIAQVGYGRSAHSRLDYAALKEGLATIATQAAQSGAIVHVPRLGAGQAGGRWDRIEASLTQELVGHGIPVVVHTLPSSRITE